MNKDEYLQKVYDKAYYDSLMEKNVFNPLDSLESYVNPNTKVPEIMLKTDVFNLKFYNYKKSLIKMEKDYLSVLYSYNLNLREYLILGFLYNGVKRSIDMRDIIPMDKNRIGNVLKRLTELEYCKPIKDYKGAPNEITPKGREKFEEIFGKLAQIDKSYST